MTASYTIALDGGSITCHWCGLTSHHAKDVEARFCGNCHRFHDDTDMVVIWTIYRYPNDYPDKWVLRAHEVQGGGATRARDVCFVGPSLEAVRVALPHGKFCLGRDLADDPAIYESWI